MIAVISDIHSNLEAFEAVLAEIKKRGVSEIYCTGDIIGYNANPGECLDLIREKKIKCILGNHETGFLTRDLSRFNPWAKAGMEWSYDKISEEDLNFVKNLGKEIKKENMTVVHGSPRSMWEYVMPNTPDVVLKQYLSEAGADILVMGHTHVPFVKKIDDKLIFNPGSAGQPRDGNKLASFALLDEKTKEAEIVRIDYDIDLAAKKIIDAGLPKLLAERLYEGW